MVDAHPRRWQVPQVVRLHGTRGGRWTTLAVMTSEPLPTAADDPPPGWVLPATTLGLVMPALASSARRDADLLRRLPPLPTERFARVRSLPGLPAAILTAVALGLALVFGFVRLGITDVHTESWLFLVLALGLGLVSPGAGLIMVLAFVPMDLLAVITRGQLDPLLPALAGRFISWWLLWLLAVVLPLVVRQVPGAVLALGRPDSPVGRRLIAYAAAVVTMSGLLWLWAGAVPELIRPVFTWTSMLGEPRPSVIGPVTDGRDSLVLAAALVVLIVTMGRDLMRVVDDETAAAIAPPVPTDRLPSLPVRLRPVRWVAATALGLVLLGAMMQLTARRGAPGRGAAAVARPGVRRLLRRFPVALLLLGQVPWLVRFALGCVGALVTSTVLTFLLGGPAFGSERFPIMVATAVALVVIALLLEVDAATDDLLREREERAEARAAAATTPDAETRETPHPAAAPILEPGPRAPIDRGRREHGRAAAGPGAARGGARPGRGTVRRGRCLPAAGRHERGGRDRGSGAAGAHPGSGRPVREPEAGCREPAPRWRRVTSGRAARSSCAGACGHARGVASGLTSDLRGGQVGGAGASSRQEAPPMDDRRVELQAEIDGHRADLFGLVASSEGLRRWLDGADLGARPAGRCGCSCATRPRWARCSPWMRRSTCRSRGTGKGSRWAARRCSRSTSSTMGPART